MGQRLRCSGRAVPYSGGGVTPVTLTPNFEFPINVTALGGKIMTASLPVTAQDLIDKLKFQAKDTGDIAVIQSGSSLVLNGGDGDLNEVTLSADGKTITFGNYSVTGVPNLTGFTYNA